MEKKCAFCNSDGPFTKEHVLPNFLYKMYNEHKFGYNFNSKKFVECERIVKDVCGKCNNGILSDLDAYGKKFLLENENNKIRIFGDKIQIFYDYDLLLRWLLKLSYNGIRSNNSYDHLISETIPYILGKKDCIADTYVLFQLLSSHKLSEREKKIIADELPNIDYFPHRGYALDSPGHYI